MIENNEIYRAMEETIQRFHCTIVRMEISILYHMIVNSQLSHDNLTRCYIIVDIMHNTSKEGSRMFNSHETTIKICP